jgi:hypothetical protein
MNTKLATLLVFAVAISLVGNAHANKDRVTGDYKAVDGVKEPPIVGKNNAVENNIIKISADKKSHDDQDHKESKKTNEKTGKVKKHSQDEKQKTKKVKDHENHKDKSADKSKKTTKKPA